MGRHETDPAHPTSPGPAGGVIATAAYIDPFINSPSPAREQRVNAVVGVLQKHGATVERLGPESLLARRWHWVSRLPRPLSRALRLFLWGSGVYEFLSSTDGLDLVIVLGTDPRFLARAAKWCEVNGVPLVDEVLDLYEFRDGETLGTKIFNLLTDHWGFRRLAHRAAGAIVATRWLGTELQRSSLPTLLMPALITGTGEVQTREPNTEGICIGYASTPLRSDIATIRNVLELAQRDLIPDHVFIEMIGTVPRQLAQLQQQVSHPRVRWHGLVPRQEALSILANCDVTMLQRPAAARWAVAGFPSKVAESLLLGKPVLANSFGDMPIYLKDERNAVILTDESAQALSVGMQRALDWFEGPQRPDPEEVADSARRAFSPATRGEEVVRFLEDVVSGHRARNRG